MTLSSRVYKSVSLESKTTEVKVLHIPRFPEILTDSDDERIPAENQGMEEAETLASKVISDAEEIAEQIVEQAKEEISRLKAMADQEIAETWQQKQVEWQEAWEQAQAQGYQAGFEEGKLEGQQIAQLEYQHLVDLAHEVLDQAHEDKGQIIAEAEPFLVSLSTEISKKLIGLEINPEITLNIVKETIERVKERESVSVCVHPRDYHYVQNQRQQLMAVADERAEVKVYPDHTIGQGGCIIRTSQGSVDARLDTQLDEIRLALMEMARHERNE